MILPQVCGIAAGDDGESIEGGGGDVDIDRGDCRLWCCIAVTLSNWIENHLKNSWKDQ